MSPARPEHDPYEDVEAWHDLQEVLGQRDREWCAEAESADEDECGSGEQ